MMLRLHAQQASGTFHQVYCFALLLFSSQLAVIDRQWAEFGNGGLAIANFNWTTGDHDDSRKSDLTINRCLCER